METEGQHVMDNTNQSINEAGVHDKFCWECHEKGKKKFNCTTCFRSFHEKCLKTINQSNCVNQEENTLICSVCLSLNQPKTDFVDKQSVFDLLKHAMAKIKRDPYFKVLKHLDGIIAMANVMDLNKINQKMNSRLYDSPNAFLEDINSVYHVCSSAKQHKVEAGYLVKMCTSEVENMLNCANCYKNMHTKTNWWTLACYQPHLVVWVKFNRNSGYWPTEKGYTHWPAKVVAADRKNLKVIFFDGSDVIEIPRNNCFSYSTTVPEAKLMSNSKDMDDVLEMVNLYAQNIRQTFGRFQANSESIPFNQRPFITHMQRMFPDYITSVISNRRGISRELDSSDEYEFDDRNDRSNDTNDISKKVRRVHVNYSGKNAANDANPMPIRATSNSFSVPYFDQYLQSLELDEAGGFNDANEIPKKIRRLSKESIPINRTSIPNASQLDLIYKLDFTENVTDVEPSDIQLNELNKSIELMTNFRNRVTNSAKTNRLTIQALRHELETLKKSQAECEAKNERHLAKIREEHVEEIAALKKAHDETVATAKTEFDKLEKDKELIHRGLETMLVKDAKSNEDHNRVLDELHKKHDKQLHCEYQKLKTEHEKVTKLEKKLQNAIDERINGEAQLMQKYNQTVNNLRVEAKKCKSCGESKSELFCSSLCESLWR
ncbi:MYND-type zinc finger-containing chromatin reader Zmynd8-like isoform X2 [Sitodiplosis mosellana]|uniref:MYND-type zinc finger-containing chromatin reader Zmynd8-like isoform X2 n=1 Tax=Sitodiplosis mosellana TaxID=263140 RepID=UPI002443F152|nr:MYND-type zinc finger-containing chromatin reader Zmynd8-like isoform X2 [Sitodiplosis mosellana]